ncbi:MAG TPA: 50S ribosomal protein L11 methyltransferase [Edaphocola sp.]|nr:50S ribosomal protein L11 methyltransferase [Edaphocola sp.]
MNYFKIEIQVNSIEEQQLWLGVLGGMEEILGVEELEGNILIAYTQDWNKIKEQVQDLAGKFKSRIIISELPDQNWNASWESNFEPVVISDFVSVRAYFHQPIPGVRYDIKITPKMSFGTGHHATTRQMMLQMSNMDFIGKYVLDYGTGTGILAILAEFLGAKHIDAIDIDEWSYTNALENVANNKCRNIKVVQGDISLLDNDFKYDIVLANINRHILLESMSELNYCLKTRGLLLLSGILKDQDIPIILEKTNQNGFELQKQTDENGWVSILFEKKSYPK